MSHAIVCCCDTNPCPPDERAQLKVTVTGSSGTVNWLGHTWNLPTDSGVQNDVCLRGGPTAPGSASAYEAWYKYVSARDGIWFSRTVRWPWHFYTTFQENVLAMRAPTTGGWFVGGTDRMNSGGSTFGLGVLTSGVPLPTYSDWWILNSWFGSITSGGITYAWARGGGWYV